MPLGSTEIETYKNILESSLILYEKTCKLNNIIFMPSTVKPLHSGHTGTKLTGHGREVAVVQRFPRKLKISISVQWGQKNLGKCGELVIGRGSIV